MKFNFKKISAIATSALMVGMTMGVAAAANYPTPFLTTPAIVYGTGEGVSMLDQTQAYNINIDLQSRATTGTGTSASISGEVYELWTGSTKVYINDSLNAVRSVITDTELPTVLADGSFSGNVDASYTQGITLGTVHSTRDKNLITFAKQPTSDDDPQLALTLGTSRTDPLYNATVTFNKAVNLTHASSEGKNIKLFGSTYTISTATTDTSLVLLKETQSVDLDSDNPSAQATVDGEAYTITLVSASDTAATIRVTDSSGTSASDEVTEDASPTKINSVSIAVTSADETNMKLSATVLVGANKLTLTDGSAITDEDDLTIDGTHVEFEPNGRTDDITKLVVSAFAPDTDEDAMVSGGEFVDPVFGSFKIQLAGFNIEADSTTAREEIAIEDSGDERMQITFTDHRGKKLSGFQFARNTTQKIELQYDSVGEKNISVREREILHVNDYAVVGNEDNGYIIKVSTVTNATTGYSSDKVTFTDAISGGSYETTITSDGAGSVTIGGQVYDVTYAALSGVDQKNVTLNAQESTGNAVNLYPTVETSKGALIAFYKPLDIDVSDFNMDLVQDDNITSFRFPDGDGFTSVAIANDYQGNVSVGGTLLGNGTWAKGIKAGPVEYNISIYPADAQNVTRIRLVNNETNTEINDPAIIIFEEKDDNSDYNSIIVTLEPGATSDDGIGVSDAVRSWGIDNVWESITMASDSKKQQEADLWGTITTLDTSDSDQNSLTISYPDEQVYAQLYAAEVGASITAGTAGSGSVAQLGNVVYKDTETTAYADKNVIIVGGSCINSAAAAVLGVSARTCGAAFTEKTGVGTGQYMIKGFASSSVTSKHALLVAGYEAAETQMATTYLTHQAVDTSKSYKGTTATTAEVVTTEVATTTTA